MQYQKIKINKIKLKKDNLIIKDILKRRFIIPIIKGSIDCKIYNEDNQEVCLSNINEGDNITIYTNKQKNDIIKKIIVKNKYVFIMESSESSEDFDF
jgi:hypothetical protein